MTRTTWDARPANLAAGLVIVALALTSCGDKPAADDQVFVPSQGCLASVAEVDARYEGAEEQFVQALTDSLDACRTAEEWLSAAREHPGAEGVTGPEFVTESFLELACRNNTDTAVCRDGISTGLLDGKY